jgi:SAM-dependent methyltransferase
VSAEVNVTHRARWEERYAGGPTPWDTGQTPPEVLAFWASGRLAPSGLALDIGCGPGTNVRYLASLGLHVVGFDIAYAPLQTGARRIHAAAPALAERGWFAQADVTQLPVHDANACYVLDLGCSHGLPPRLRPAYARGIIANLAPGGYYHLYAFDTITRPEAEAGDRDMGYHGGEVVALFGADLEIVEIEQATPNPYPCKWCLFRKPLQAPPMP